jgi:hypothetical protein
VKADARLPLNPSRKLSSDPSDDEERESRSTRNSALERPLLNIGHDIRESRERQSESYGQARDSQAYKQLGPSGEEGVELVEG